MVMYPHRILTLFFSFWGLSESQVDSILFELVDIKFFVVEKKSYSWKQLQNYPVFYNQRFFKDGSKIIVVIYWNWNVVENWKQIFLINIVFVNFVIFPFRIECFIFNAPIIYFPFLSFLILKRESLS